MKQLQSLFVIVLFFASTWFFESDAKVYRADPSNYLSFVSQLQPGDTLLLAAGIYNERLKLTGVQGMQGAPIVISGPDAPATAVFLGNACCNTVSLTRCSYLVIERLTLDGQNIPFIDAVKAEGTPGNWTHDITLQYLQIINHGAERLTVGINAKCPSWNWIIRQNEIIEAGTGIYLGAPDGTAPFVNGLIEYNLIRNPLGYGCQIKHQIEGQRTMPGMVQEGKTVIRYNVIAKVENNDNNNPRPNLLVGHFPESGPGSDDRYEIYGNLLWKNPKEGLFQGTGNIAFYNNLLVNDSHAGWGIFMFPHNNFPPRDIHIFQNTVCTKTEGIRLVGCNTQYEQIIAGNAVFSQDPIDTDGNEYENIMAGFNEAPSSLTNPTPDIATCLLTPLPPSLLGDQIDPGPFEMFERYNWDFDGRPHNWARRGAYVSPGLSEWKLELEIREEVQDLPTSIRPKYQADHWNAELTGSPGTSGQVRLHVECAEETELRWALLDAAGHFLKALAVVDCRSGINTLYPFKGLSLPSGTYYILLDDGYYRDIKTAVHIH